MVNITLKGGSIAGNARKEIEKETGKKVISLDNFKDTQRRLQK